VAAAAAWLLRSRARFSLMLPAARLTDAFDTLRRHRLEPKRLRLVHANAQRPARLALMEAMLDVNPGLIIEPPLIVKNSDGTDTAEIARIYHQDQSE
jgi:tRNA1(Val) A37 N6-methylase TrmN6